MADVHQEIIFAASPERIYEAFMDSTQHERFTANGVANISREPGGEFTCHGGIISGRNIELVPNNRIVQAWRSARWHKGIYSIARFELQPRENGTLLVLDHTGIPDDQREDIEAGWHTRYWEPLRKYLQN